MRVVTHIRTAAPADLPAVFELQSTVPEAAQWNDYSHADLLLAEHDGRIAGFLATRRIAPHESEVLNLAVDPALRRNGIACRLLARFVQDQPGDVFLEVRESNSTAQKLYEAFGFQRVGLRKAYYENPSESAVVMKMHSC